MSFGGRAASSSGCAIRPRGHETGSTGYIGRTPSSSPTGHYVMATAEHREPCESRGSCTVLGAPGGETPPGDSTRKQTRPLMNGSRTSRPAPRCGNGSATIPPAGRNFAAATPWRSTSILNSLAGYVPWQDKARSRSCTRLTTRFITTQLRYGIFYWDDKRSESPRRLADNLARRYASQDGQRRLRAARSQGSERWTEFSNQTFRRVRTLVRARSGLQRNETPAYDGLGEDQTAATRSHCLDPERGGRPDCPEPLAASTGGHSSRNPHGPALDQHLVDDTDRSGCARSPGRPRTELA